MVGADGVGACCCGGAAESSSTGRSSFQTPAEREATAWVVEALADPKRVSRPSFRARSWRAGTGWTTRSRGTGLGWGDRAGRLTSRFGRRLLLGWLCLLIRRLLIRRLLWLRRAATCGATGSWAARLRWTNRSSGSLRSAAATSNSCATRTRRCDLLLAGALPVGTLVLLVRSLRGWTSTWSGRWLSIRRAPGGLLRAGRLYFGRPLRGLLGVRLLGVGLLGLPWRTGDPGLRIPTLRVPALRTSALGVPPCGTPA